ncbi:hypothetical protein [Sebaldella sp. S0638]|uniref:hypothetical protein n=1 Tax=Sebaldella sp. S0638 TaxID=2957809 RepID=UPI00209FEBF7|nr:hypothetical protein [Sebaldella sp. S0638]MCP1223185.1 hypothetical protein [Sebaldella sp. S0638]
MKKNKKLLITLLALNGILSAYPAGNQLPDSVKYEKLYNTMTKNMNQGKSNESSYKLIEKILKKKNKELKDLYSQGDYVVKPEYLEWQIFFTGFYNEDARVGSLSSNHAREGNDSDSNWSGKDKPMIQADSYKEVKIGPSIPYKYLNLQDINPDISLPVIDSVASINLNKIPLVIDIPQLPALPNIQLNTVDATDINDIVINKNVQVTPISINVAAKSFGAVSVPSPVLGVNGNGYYASADNVDYFTNVETLAVTTLPNNFRKNGVDATTGLIQIIGVKNSTYLSPTPAQTAGNLTYTLTQNLTTEFGGTRIILIESHRGAPIPNSTGSTPGDQNDVLFVKTTGTLNINANNSIGVEMEQGYNTGGTVRNDSAYINAGTITSGYSNVMGIDFKAGPRGPLYAENQGKIILSGNSSVGIKSSDVSGIRIGIVNESSGEITLNGSSSVAIAAVNGIFTPATITANNFSGGSYTTGLRQNGTININGTNNLGVVVRNSGAVFSPDSSLNNNSGKINLAGSNGAGIYLDYVGASFTNYGNITISANSNNTGIRIDNGTIANKYVLGNEIRISGNSSDNTGIAAVNSASTGVNEGKILINSTGSKNIGLYGTGGGGTRISNSGSNAEIKLDLSAASGSENIGASIIGSGSIFSNSGTITLIDKNTTGRNVGIYSENGTVNHTGAVNLTTSGNDIGIYLKGASGGTLGGKINLSSSGNAYDYGIYYDNGYTGNAGVSSVISLEGKAAGIFSAVRGITFGGTVNMTSLSTDSIGLLYQITVASPTGNILTNNGTVNATAGTGIYLYNNTSASGRTVVNGTSGNINVNDGGVGIVAESSAYTSGDKVEIVNNGTIRNTGLSSTANSIGIYAKNHDIKVTGSGKIRVESPDSENLGVFVKGGKVEFESKIELENGGIGVYLDGDKLNANDSVLDIGKTAGAITAVTDGTGIVAKGEKATVNILSGSIELDGHSLSNKGSLGVFLEDSNLNNNGLIKTGDYGTSVYLKSVLSARDIKLGSLETGDKGVALYLENQNEVDSLTSIKTGENGIAVYSKNGDIDTSILDSAKFTLGKGSTGYFLENGNLKSTSGTANLILGNDVTGVALTGTSAVDSSINSITIGDNTGSGTGIKPIVLGIKEIASPLTLTTKLAGGDGTVGLYYQEEGTGNTVTYNGGSSTVTPDIKVGTAGGTLSSVGVYLKADTGINALNLNNTYIQVNGKSGIVLGADTGTINVTGGKVELTEGGVLFLVKNGGSINVSPGTIIITPDSGIELYRVIYSDYTNASGTTLEIPKESVAIHGETGIMTNSGELVSKLIGGTPAESSIGMYIENTKEIAANTLEFANTFSQGVNKNKIDLGNKGIGIFGENSHIWNDTSGVINVKNEGAGLYATIGSIIENKGIINIGENSVGMYATDRTGSPSYAGLTKENYLTNSGKIISAGNNTIGISSAGVDPTKRSEIDNSGTIELSGLNTTGIYGNRTNIIKTGNITAGNGSDTGGTIEYASGILGNESDINIQNGQIQTGNYSIGAAAVGNSVLNITGGSITVGENSIFNYIKKGTGSGISLNDTSGGTYDLNKNKQIGIYAEEGNVISNKTLEVRTGTDSIGVYALNNGAANMSVQGLTVNVENGQKGIFVKAASGSGVKVTLANSVNLNGNSALGIIHQNGDVENNGTINISGEA